MDNSPLVPPTPFETRIQALQKRVNEAADALHAKGIKPTVQRIRAALGGGSPNDLTPALKHWRDEILPTLQTVGSKATGIPSQVADLARELWTRALAAAEVDRKSGPAAIARIARSEEVHALREQIRELRDQLDKEAVRYGELRAQVARYEAIAKQSLGRARDLEAHARKSLQAAGASRQKLIELQATVERLRSKERRPKPSARRSVAKSTHKTRRSASVGGTRGAKRR